MTALQIILSIAGIVAYGCTAFMALEAWGRLRCMQRKFDSLHGTQRMMFAMLMDGNIRQNQEALKQLSEQMQQAVDDDRFEDAEQLKKIIAERERYIMEQLAYIKSEFSNECEVRMYRTRADGKEE